MLRSLIVAPAAAIVLLGLATAPTAAASTAASSASVSVVGTRLTFVAGAHQEDFVEFVYASDTSTWVVRDYAPGGMAAGAGCAATSATEVQCDATINAALVELGDRSDSFADDAPTPELPITVDGGAGDDRLITGGRASDVLHGGPGNDFMQGYGGGDVYRGGSGVDAVSYYGVLGDADLGEGVTVTDDGIANDGFPGDHDNVTGVEAVIGTNHDDSITLRSGTLDGAGGNDALTITSGGGREFGYAGNDTLRGGPGRTLLSGGKGVDTLFSADNHPDHDNCGGGGQDVVTADAYDSVINCEIVHLTP